MSQINILSPHLADLIAAGEVVERPASVVKELMENSFDAGARHVTVEILNGGATMIRVTDDGCGMAPDDAGLAFQRHATSKLHDEHGLEAILTMGFRGEALAAISAVSRIELQTRRAEDGEGTFVSIAAGEIQEMEPVGCPAGTDICIQDLFYNTPARLKFLKTDRSEASACAQTALRCALGRPEISVRFLRDGKEEFFTPGDGDTKACCYALLGREAVSELLSVCSEDEGLRLSGFVSSPAAGRGNRSMQFFFVNGRFIRSQMLQSALEQAYKNTLLVGRYPACVLYLEIRPGAVDVNVHPAKTEVKFSEERKVFSLFYQAIRDTLDREDRIHTDLPVTVRDEYEFPPHGRPDSEIVSSSQLSSFGPVSVPKLSTVPESERGSSSACTPGRLTASTDISSSDAFCSAPLPAAGVPRKSLSDAGLPEESPFRAFSSPVSAYEPGSFSHSEVSEKEIPDQVFTPSDTSFQGRTDKSASGESVQEQLRMDLSDDPVENSVQDVDNSEVPDHKIVGEAFQTYIIVETGDRLILIDKHAAHERMNFDRLKAMTQPVMSQRLLFPQTLHLDREQLALLELYGTLFEEFGFELEPFGEDEVILRAVPADIRSSDALPALEEILEHLGRGAAPDPLSARDELLHTVACKAAIKAGWLSGPQELEKLAIEVLSGRIRYCPHGRPVSITLTRKDLDKLFKRIV